MESIYSGKRSWNFFRLVLQMPLWKFGAIIGLGASAFTTFVLTYDQFSGANTINPSSTNLTDEQKEILQTKFLVILVTSIFVTVIALLLKYLLQTNKQILLLSSLLFGALGTTYSIDYK